MNILQNNDARCEVDGVEYNAVTAPTGMCFGDFGKCAGFLTPLCATFTEVACHAHMRNDKTNVIWVKAVP